MFERGPRVPSFVIQKPFFPPYSSTVPDERSIRTNHSMAWHNERYFVGTVCLSNLAGFLRLSERFSNVTIASCLSRRNLSQGLPDGFFERCAMLGRRDLEICRLTGEIIVELSDEHFLEQCWCLNRSVQSFALDDEVRLLMPHDSEIRVGIMLRHPRRRPSTLEGC